MKVGENNLGRFHTLLRITAFCVSNCLRLSCSKIKGQKAEFRQDKKCSHILCSIMEFSKPAVQDFASRKSNDVFWGSYSLVYCENTPKIVIVSLQVIASIENFKKWPQISTFCGNLLQDLSLWSILTALCKNTTLQMKNRRFNVDDFKPKYFFQQALSNESSLNHFREI